MSLCHCFKRRWHAFKNIVYGYEDETYNYRERYEEDPCESLPKEQNRRVHFSEKKHSGEVFEEYKMCSENLCNYCIPKRQVYEAYGIEFTSREERDAFESKMECMEKILENELVEIRQQHIRLREERSKNPRLKQRKGGKRTKNDSNASTVERSPTHYFSRTWQTLDDSNFLRTDDNPLVEEVSIVNEVQDVLDQMCNLSRELKDIEKILSIEVRERILHPEPRLIQIKAPEDELSKQMKNDGGFCYCSSDRSVHRISYDTLPPPLTLSELLAKQSERDDDT
jgi:hypothetical protein